MLVHTLAAQAKAKAKAKAGLGLRNVQELFYVLTLASGTWTRQGMDLNFECSAPLPGGTCPDPPPKLNLKLCKTAFEAQLK